MAIMCPFPIIVIKSLIAKSLSQVDLNLKMEFLTDSCHDMGSLALRTTLASGYISSNSLIYNFISYDYYDTLMYL